MSDEREIAGRARVNVPASPYPMPEEPLAPLEKPRHKGPFRPRPRPQAGGPGDADPSPADLPDPPTKCPSCGLLAVQEGECLNCEYAQV